MTHAFVRTYDRNAAVYRQGNYKFSVGLLALACGVCSEATAVDLVKASNNNSLNLAASWSPAQVPTSSDILIFDNSLSANVAANVSNNATNLSASGIRMDNTTRTITLSVANSTSGILSLGASGITKTANTGAFIIAAPVSLSSSQNWTIGTTTGSTRLQYNATSLATNGNALNITGVGDLDFRPVGNLTLDSNVTIATPTLINATTANVTFQGLHTFGSLQIISGRLIGSSFGNFGANSSFGTGGVSSAIILGGGASSHGIFEYAGGDVSSNRTFNFDRRSASSELRNGNSTSTLTLSGLISNAQGTSTVNSTINIGGDGNIVLSGNQQIRDHADTGAAALTTLNKVGSGTLTISGSNNTTSGTSATYMGATNVNGGRLVISGSGNINSTSGVFVASVGQFIYDSSTGLTRDVTVNGGRFAYNSAANFTGALTFNSGTLAGTNFSGVNFTVGAGDVLAPGNSTGAMSAGAVTWGNGGAFEFEINDATGVAGAASGWDLLNPASLNITAGAGQFTVNLVSLTAGQAAGAAQNFNPNSNYSWLFVDSGSAITSFSASSFVLSATGFSNTFDGSFSIVQGTGLDTDKLYINYTSAIPEPSSFAILAGLGAVGFVGLRRRRRS